MAELPARLENVERKPRRETRRTRLVRERDSWGPPVVAVAATPVLLAPWLVPLVTTGSAAGLLLEAGRLTVDRVTFTGLLTGRLNDLGAPVWLGVVLALLAFAALIPRRASHRGRARPPAAST